MYARRAERDTGDREVDRCRCAYSAQHGRQDKERAKVGPRRVVGIGPVNRLLSIERSQTQPRWLSS